MTQLKLVYAKQGAIGAHKGDVQAWVDPGAQVLSWELSVLHLSSGHALS